MDDDAETTAVSKLLANGPERLEDTSRDWNMKPAAALRPKFYDMVCFLVGEDRLEQMETTYRDFFQPGIEVTMNGELFTNVDGEEEKEKEENNIDEHLEYQSSFDFFITASPEPKRQGLKVKSSVSKRQGLKVKSSVSKPPRRMITRSMAKRASAKSKQSL